MMRKTYCPTMAVSKDKGEKTMNEPITTKEHAYLNAYKAMKSKGLRIQNIVPINKGRYRIVYTNKRPLLLIYKSDVLMTFCRVSGQKTAGETVNRTDLRIAVRRGCRDIIRVTGTGQIMACSIADFIEKSYGWENNEGKEVLSCPITTFKNIKDYEVVT